MRVSYCALVRRGLWVRPHFITIFWGRTSEKRVSQAGILARGGGTRIILYPTKKGKPKALIVLDKMTSETPIVSCGL